jgi:hypothetical protein
VTAHPDNFLRDYELGIIQDPGLLKRLQSLAWLEAHRFPGYDRDCCASARVAAKAELARAHVEDPESPKLDALATAECPFHTIKNGFDGSRGASFGDTSLVDDILNDIQFNQIFTLG